MAAGQNVRFNVWRINYQNDDAVGGAVISGTVAYFDVQARFQANPDEQMLLQQGLETNRTFTALLAPGTLDIRERDQLELVQPIDHPYYGRRFRIVSFRYSDFNPRDPRNYILLILSRIVRGRQEEQL